MGLWKIASFSLVHTSHCRQIKNPWYQFLLDLYEATPRLQRLLIKASAYDFSVYSRTNKSSCRLSQLTWMHQGQHSSTQVESQCHNPAAVQPRWCNSRHQVRNSQGWWTVTVEAHCDNRMTRMNQRSPKRSTTILDIQRRADSGKWSTSEVNMNYHPKSDERQVPEWAAHRTPWSYQIHRTGKTDYILARYKQWNQTICKKLLAMLEICSI